MNASKNKPTGKVVLTGIASRFGRMLARALHQKYSVIGLDPRGAHHMPQDIEVLAYDIRRKKAEDVFRRENIQAVIHLPAEGGAMRGRTEGRHQAVIGTRRILEFCRKHDVPKVVIVSSAALYGPSPDNNQFLTEEAPLLAGRQNSAMRDLVEADMIGTTFFWRHPEVDTVVLRPAHLVGRIGNAVSQYLRSQPVPTVMGYDPMVQVLSPDDAIDAIMLALKPGIRGVFNIAGPAPAPLSEVLRRLRRTRLPLPEPLLRATIRPMLKRGGKTLGPIELDHLKYVCMVDDSAARATLGYRPLRTLDQTLIHIRA